VIRIKAPKHWAYRNSDGEYITDPEIRDGTEKVVRVRFVTDSDYRKLTAEPVSGAGQYCHLCRNVHDLLSACPPASGPAMTGAK